ncbi:hypothetical protein RGQ29_028002 [Quercus rubra]|uniref:Uncharacterized protein n=1 Tax=Quercus rubra TaxID=3512 RepID=A0AAN7EQZ6_QUERU|nr:hypothetical protein RGQ29_028002 [Quercus rubra]
MSNLTKLEFAALDISSKNYLSWILDVEIHLEAMALAETIKDDIEESPQNRAKAMIVIHHHFYEELKMKLCGEKVTEEDMLEKTFTTFHASNKLLQ